MPSKQCQNTEAVGYFLLLIVIQIDKKRAVDETDGRLWADAHGFLYFEVSALTGDGISDLFQVNDKL